MMLPTRSIQRGGSALSTASSPRVLQLPQQQRQTPTPQTTQHAPAGLAMGDPTATTSVVESRPIRCFVRVRPFTQAEQARGGEGCISVGDDGKSLRLKTSSGTPGSAVSPTAVASPTSSTGNNNSNTVDMPCTFDEVFLPDTDVNTICKTILVPTTRDVMQGYRNAIVCYGQTGGGKTFTLRQLAPTLARMLLTIGRREDDTHELTVSVEIIEIYLEQVTDLLDPTRKNLQVREFPDTGVFVKGASEETVSSIGAFEALWGRAMNSRQCGATALKDKRAF
ncbi:kinesin, putative [Bodo saltans]|uniref:Kinesin, putative n=1 Tax=Bodo saltans TaxID=75058 RepID=A0A0S4IUY0_BODSA|nr:kinesin, putative [Bodo saltans]|eukprot:CUF44575.1 kinesin, putative [Bodo saltans]